LCHSSETQCGEAVHHVRRAAIAELYTALPEELLVA
jgi:hypothetical protein